MSRYSRAHYQDLARVVSEGRDVVERALRSRALPDRPGRTG